MKKKRKKERRRSVNRLVDPPSSCRKEEVQTTWALGRRDWGRDGATEQGEGKRSPSEKPYLSLHWGKEQDVLFFLQVGGEIKRPSHCSVKGARMNPSLCEKRGKKKHYAHPAGEGGETDQEKRKVRVMVHQPHPQDGKRSDGPGLGQNNVEGTGGRRKRHRDGGKERAQRLEKKAFKPKTGSRRSTPSVKYRRGGRERKGERDVAVLQNSAFA